MSWGKTETIAYVSLQPFHIAQKISSGVTPLPYIRSTQQLNNKNSIVVVVLIVEVVVVVLVVVVIVVLVVVVVAVVETYVHMVCN